MSNSTGKITDAVLTKVNGIYDISIDAHGDIVTEEFFDTSILMSLFCEQRATESEVPVSKNRRGWIGNEETPGFEIGSKIWLYDQSRLTRSVLNSISSVATSSLQWMIDDGFAISVKADAVITNNGVDILITIERPNSSVEKRNYKLWENTGNAN